MTHHPPTDLDAPRLAAPPAGEPAGRVAQHVVLMGLMGTGKTVVGRSVAAEMGIPHTDNDTVIGAKTDLTARQIGERHGLRVLHDLEAHHLLDALVQPLPTVICAAASVVDDERCRAALAASGAFKVWLRARADTLAARFGQEDHRPIFGSEAEVLFRAQIAERSPHFEALASAVVDVDDLTVAEVAARVLALLDESPGASDALATLVRPDASLSRLATGFRFTEGPVWRADGSLHFSDIPGNKRYRWHPEEGASVLRDPNFHGNGMTLDDEGNLLVCEHATSAVVRELVDGEREIVASHWQGRELNSPNDVVVARDGSIYFTDPWYGRMPVFGVERPRELDHQGVYRVTPDGELHLLADDFAMPNGLCFSPNESLLYVNDTERAHIRVFDVAADGSLANGRLFLEEIRAPDHGGVPDGMKADERGNVYVTGPGGIWIVRPDGTRLETIEVPEVVGNLNWGGPDWSTLYICASTSVYALELDVAGNRLGYMR